MTRELSPRQIQILRLMADGFSAGKIARELKISVGTVRTHQATIYKRLGVRNAAHAVSEGLRTGYIEGAA